MNFKEIQELIRLVSKSDLAEFKIKDGEFELSIRTKWYNARQTGTTYVTPQSLNIPAQMAQSEVAFSQNTAAEQMPTVSEPKPVEAIPKPASDGNYLPVKSPMVGTFYRSASPDKPAYVKVGDKIQKGSVVCIVEAMKLFNEIESDVSGTVVKVVVDDAQPVEYDQVLFLVEP